jgi:glutamate dehydrogenase
MKQAFAYLANTYDANLLEKILRPDQVIQVAIPVTMDDGSTKVFTGFRSQHNNIKGPYKGGLRFHPQVSQDEVMSLSAWMTLKTSVVGIPLGGGKGGIIVDPKTLSVGELERLSRSFTQKIRKYIGPQTDVPAPDVNTTPQIMAWMVDEYSKLVGTWTPGVITGKPIAIGWSLGRTIATSLGGRFTVTEYLKAKNQEISGKSIAVQGAGNVGLLFAKIAYENGAKVVAISDSKWGIYDANGLDIIQIEQLKEAGKSVVDYAADKISNEQLLELQVDILVPAALEQVIHQNNASNIKAPLILELANGPVTPEADNILSQKNIAVIPDVLANAGGVTVSYFEQVQNNTNYYRPEAEVHQKLEQIMRPATRQVLDTQVKYTTSNLRMAAYVVSLERILAAMKLRG